jgi:hypothetical protein
MALASGSQVPFFKRFKVVVSVVNPLVMSVALVLLLSLNSELQNGIAQLFMLMWKHNFFLAILAGLMFILIFGGGIFLSFYSLFKPRSKFADAALLLFLRMGNLVSIGAVLFTNIIGFFTALAIDLGVQGEVGSVWFWLSFILPMLNFQIIIFQAELTDVQMSAKMASKPVVVLAVVSAAVLFFLCQYALGLHWAYTLSICVFYSTIITSLFSGIERILSNHLEGRA